MSLSGPVLTHSAAQQFFFVYTAAIFFLYHSLFRKDCGGSSSRLSRHTFQFANSDCISLGQSLKQFQPRSQLYSTHLVRDRPTGLFHSSKRHFAPASLAGILTNVPATSLERRLRKRKVIVHWFTNPWMSSLVQA